MNKTESALNNKGIENEYQLRRWLPSGYQDFSKETGCIIGDAVCIGVLLSCQQKESGSGNKYFLIRIQDRKTGYIIKVLVFNQPYAYSRYVELIGKMVVVAGNMALDYSNEYTIAGPDLLTDDIENNCKILPVYPRIGKTKPFYVKKYVHEACCVGENDTLPPVVRNKYELPGLAWSLYELHHPSNIDNLRDADRRLLVDDLFYFAACNEMNDRQNNLECTLPAMADCQLVTSLLAHFEYELTKDQQMTFLNVQKRMSEGKKVQALVQGDVGCGKTIVALLSMAQAVSNGFQAAIMAPTKILAEQHYNELCKLLPDYSDQILLTSGKTVTKKEKDKIKDGTYRFLIGTQSLLADSIEYHNLGLIVIDEEHKFGVLQREKLLNKAKTVHYISMSATPIPRTLAAALYGKATEIYSIKSMPAGRKPVFTAYDNGSNVALYVSTALKRNEQVYVVCPAIDNDEGKMSGVLAVNEAEKIYKQICPGAKIATLSGKMSAAETEDIISKFKRNEIQVLISTTVIEVGVNVPNATLIIIHNAERFGLAGMHQLRGRVGRGNKQSCCLLISEHINPRIEALCATTDGFKIAEIDLDLRKSGSIFGTEQSGFNILTEEIINNNELYLKLRDEVSIYSSQVLLDHITKLRLCHNDKCKRKLIHGVGGPTYAFYSQQA